MRMRRWLLGLAGALAVALAACAADSDALWKIINDRCVPGQAQRGDPTPCARVDVANGIAHGTVVLKDRNGIAQYLLMPSAKIPGIESPEILAEDAPNYFAAAWEARDYMNARLPRPLSREATSLAVNSSVGRTQNQLHIHISCLRADIRDALIAQRDAVGDDWAKLPAPLRGHPYQAMRLLGEAMTANPFRLLADRVAGAHADMGLRTLVAVGATFADGQPGFLLLTDRADPINNDRASGEELQDHDCAVASN